MSVEWPGSDPREWEALREDYEAAMISASLKETVTPIRYDYAPGQYKAGRHPASHVHCGFNNEIRVCTKRIVQPFSFACFIIRQRYPDCWQNLLTQMDCRQLSARIVDGLEAVPNDYFGEPDACEFSLH